MERRREFAAGVMARFGFARHDVQRDPTVPQREEVTPEEIAETMAMVNARSAERAAEMARREAVAQELSAMGLGDGGALK
jgi:hypothetical protein